MENSCTYLYLLGITIRLHKMQPQSSDLEENCRRTSHRLMQHLLCVQPSRGEQRQLFLKFLGFTHVTNSLSTVTIRYMYLGVPQA